MRVLIRQIKHAADLLAFEFAAQGLPVKIVYPGFGYGCSQATSHPSLHEQTLLRMAAGKPVAIMGSGKNRLSFLESIRATWLDYQQQGWSS